MNAKERERARQRAKYLARLARMGKSPQKASKIANFMTNYELESVYCSAIRNLAVKLVRAGYSLDELADFMGNN